MIASADQVCSNRVVLVCGHYGTGKTEFAVNYALGLAHAGHTAMLADVDIVNPYFRSRERKELLEAAEIGRASCRERV